MPLGETDIDLPATEEKEKKKDKHSYKLITSFCLHILSIYCTTSPAMKSLTEEIT